MKTLFFLHIQYHDFRIKQFFFEKEGDYQYLKVYIDSSNDDHFDEVCKLIENIQPLDKPTKDWDDFVTIRIFL